MNDIKYKSHIKTYYVSDRIGATAIKITADACIETYCVSDRIGAKAIKITGNAFRKDD